MNDHKETTPLRLWVDWASGTPYVARPTSDSPGAEAASFSTSRTSVS